MSGPPYADAPPRLLTRRKGAAPITTTPRTFTPASQNIFNAPPTGPSFLSAPAPGAPAPPTQQSTGLSRFMRSSRDSPGPSSSSSSASLSGARNALGNPVESDVERKKRFDKELQGSGGSNKFLELKAEREKLMKYYISAGLLPDPSKPLDLSTAQNLRGTCMLMCPEYEREEREFQNEADVLELYPGTNKIDPSIAVKIYRRPAAGRELPLPEDVRPPAVLRRTLDYLFHVLLPSDPSSSKFASVQGFLWNRTRAIRQDFIVQGQSGPLTIECHERIARYHILCLHWQGGLGSEEWSEQQELEQLRKTIRSLTEFYADIRAQTGKSAPNEAEFRAYNLLLHHRDPETLREIESLPNIIFDAPSVQCALKLRAFAQGAGSTRPVRAEAALNLWTRFFAELKSPRANYLLACLAENIFPQVRAGAVRAMGMAYLGLHAPLATEDLRSMLSMDTPQEAREFVRGRGFPEVAVVNEGGESKVAMRVDRNTERIPVDERSMRAPFSRSVVEAKRGHWTCQDFVDGVASGATPLLTHDKGQALPAVFHEPRSRTTSAAIVDAWNATSSVGAPSAVQASPSMMRPNTSSFNSISTPASSASASSSYASVWGASQQQQLQSQFQQGAAGMQGVTTVGKAPTAAALAAAREAAKPYSKPLASSSSSSTLVFGAASAFGGGNASASLSMPSFSSSTLAATGTSTIAKSPNNNNTIQRTSPFAAAHEQQTTQTSSGVTSPLPAPSSSSSVVPVSKLTFSAFEQTAAPVSGVVPSAAAQPVPLSSGSAGNVFAQPSLTPTEAQRRRDDFGTNGMGLQHVTMPSMTTTTMGQSKVGTQKSSSMSADTTHNIVAPTRSRLADEPRQWHYAKEEEETSTASPSQPRRSGKVAAALASPTAAVTKQEEQKRKREAELEAEAREELFGAMMGDWIEEAMRDVGKNAVWSAAQEAVGKVWSQEMTMRRALRRWSDALRRVQEARGQTQRLQDVRTKLKQHHQASPVQAQNGMESKARRSILFGECASASPSAAATRQQASSTPAQQQQDEANQTSQTDAAMQDSLKRARSQRDVLWKQGTFLDTLVARIESLSTPAVGTWRVLVAPAGSGPASTWLCEKFAVHAQKTTERSPSSALAARPLRIRCTRIEAQQQDGSVEQLEADVGLVLFECASSTTPEALEADKARLERITQALSLRPGRFVPSLMVLSWISEEAQAKPISAETLLQTLGTLPNSPWGRTAVYALRDAADQTDQRFAHLVAQVLPTLAWNSQRFTAGFAQLGQALRQAWRAAAQQAHDLVLRMAALTANEARQAERVGVRALATVTALANHALRSIVNAAGLAEGDLMFDVELPRIACKDASSSTSNTKEMAVCGLNVRLYEAAEQQLSLALEQDESSFALVQPFLLQARATEQAFPLASYTEAMFTAALDRLEVALAGRLELSPVQVDAHFVELEKLVRETLDELVEQERALREQQRQRQASAVELLSIEIPSPSLATPQPSTSTKKRKKKRRQRSPSPSTAKKQRSATTPTESPPAPKGRTSLTSAVARASDSVTSLRAMMAEAERLINSGHI